MCEKQILILGSSQRKLYSLENNKIIYKGNNICSLEDLRSLDLKDKITLVSNIRKDLEKEINILKQTNNLILFDKFKASKDFNISNIYESFGNDRVANIIGALTLKINSFIVIDLGTYTTITSIDFINNSYKLDLNLNMIMLGLSKLLSGISKDLCLISDFDFIKYNIEENFNYNETQKAIYRSLNFYILALIQELQNLKPESKIIITGGWCEIIKNKIQNQNNIIIERDLAALGLKEYLTTNPPR